MDTSLQTDKLVFFFFNRQLLYQVPLWSHKLSYPHLASLILHLNTPLP